MEIAEAPWPSTLGKHEIVTFWEQQAFRLDHEEVGGSLGNQNRFDFLQRNHPHSLSGWHVTFYNESKVWFNLKGKGWKKKNQQPNSLLAKEPHIQDLV